MNKSFKSWETGIKPVINLLLSDGSNITLTPNHLIKLSNGNYIEAQETIGKRIDRIGDRYYKKEPIDNNDKLILLGFLYGDGFICGNGHGISVKLNKNREPDVFDFLQKNGFNYQPSGAFYINKIELNERYKYEKIFNLNLLGEKSPDKFLPNDVICSDLEQLRSFLTGIYSANGSVVKKKFISFKTASKKLVKQLQIILSAYGIKAYFSTNKPKNITWNNGDYTSKESYNLFVTNKKSLIRFKKYIGFIETRKNNELDD